MADEKKQENPPASPASVPPKPQDSGQGNPANAAAEAAAKVDSPDVDKTQAAIAGEDEKTPSKPAKYRLKENMRHTVIMEGSRRTFIGGTDDDVVELTPEQFASFKDKFEDKPVAKR